jgi:hypothetical protein
MDIFFSKRNFTGPVRTLLGPDFRRSLIDFVTE